MTSSCFERPGVDELDRAAAGDEPADLLERPLRRREPDPLERLARQALEPLDGQRQVRAALRPGDGVHLVENQGPDAGERVARAGGQQQIERLGRRDQQVGRMPEHRRALLLGRVAGPHRDLDVGLEAGERPAQVALDVVVQRLERRDVDEPRSFTWLRDQPVEAEEEGGEGLTRAGRRLDQRVRAGGDLRPAELLRRRRPVEGLLEPGARLRAEGGKRVHAASLAKRSGSNKCSMLPAARRLYLAKDTVAACLAWLPIRRVGFPLSTANQMTFGSRRA